MSERFDSKKKVSGNFRKLLQERIGKSNPRRKLTAEEQRRLSKLEVIEAKLKRGENVQKRLCKEFGFTAGMLKGSIAEGRKPKSES